MFHKSSETLFGYPVYRKELRNQLSIKLAFTEIDSIYTQSINIPSSVRLLIYISKHKSESGTPTLSVHVPGNLGEATLGGIPRTVSVAPACAMKEALMSLKKGQEEMKLDFDVSYECTHHGPSFNIPVMFVELGSSPTQWNDTKAADVVARSVLAAASTQKDYPAVLGIGGPHYNFKFTREALNTEIAFGHIISKHAVRELDLEILKQCITRTVEPVWKIVLDWKGIKGVDKDWLIKLLSETGVEIEKI